MNAFHGAKFKAFYQGSTVGYDSQSESDLALCNHLATGLTIMCLPSIDSSGGPDSIVKSGIEVRDPVKPMAKEQSDSH